MTRHIINILTEIQLIQWMFILWVINRLLNPESIADVLVLLLLSVASIIVGISVIWMILSKVFSKPHYGINEDSLSMIGVNLLLIGNGFVHVFPDLIISVPGVGLIRVLDISIIINVFALVLSVYSLCYEYDWKKLRPKTKSSQKNHLKVLQKNLVGGTQHE